MTTREERRDGIRRRLLQVTERLIADGEPYSTVPIERLATEAGVSRATFYIYFDSKADLLRHGFGEAVDELQAVAERWLAFDTETTPEEMRAVAAGLLRAYRGHAALLTAVFDEATQDSSLRQRIAEILRAATEALAQAIEGGQAAGWVDPELLAPETAAWIIWLLERGLARTAVTATDAQLDASASTLAAMAWHTLRPTS